MSKTITFAKGATSVEARAYLTPFVKDYDSMQAVAFSDDGDPMVDRLGEPREVWDLSFRNVTTAIRNSLKSFYETTIEGARYTFDFTDVDDTVYNNVRWLGDHFDFQMDTEDRWSGTITLQFE